MTKMKSLRKIQIAAASALVCLSLYGCNQNGETTSPPSTNLEATAQPMPQMTPPMTAPTPTNNPPGSTPASSPLPEVTMPTSTNELPTAAPLPVTQQ